MTARTGNSRAVLLAAWMLALIGLAVISRHYGGESDRFFGISDDQEQTVRFTMPVQIESYGFVSGQEVGAGDLIVEVRQPDIDAEIQIVAERIQGLKFGNRETRASMQSEIVQQDADLQASLTELDSQIRGLRARADAARTILQGLDRDSSDGAGPAVRREIDSLTERKHAIRRATAARINDLSSRLAASKRPVDAQIAELEQRQRDLERQQADLRVFAQFTGRVGSVLFKVGETVPPYQPVLTLHGSRPSFIRGYIHEDVFNDVRLRQTVWVQSLSSLHADIWHEGVVESIGSRIVEFPVRLKVNPLMQAWGREVLVRLRDDHTLLLGEKVHVQLERPVVAFPQLRAMLTERTP